MQFNRTLLAASLGLVSTISSAQDNPFWFNLTDDYSYVATGGIEPYQKTNRYLVDTGYLYQVDGIDFTISAQIQRGNNGSDPVGDIQAYSNIDEDNFSKIYEAYSYIRLPHQIDLMVGKVDANGIFAYSDNAAEFINSSMGFSPTIAALPTYPEPALSINLIQNYHQGHHLAAGVYAGNSASSFADKFYIVEGGYAIDDGRVKLGYWHHDGQWQPHEDALTEAGTGGLYLIADYNWPQQKIAAYLQYGHADKQLVEIKQHLGFGLVFDQTLGFGISRAWLGQQNSSNQDETTAELFYLWQANDWLTIKPDLQYIRHPSGNQQIANAVVSTIRVMIAI